MTHATEKEDRRTREIRRVTLVGSLCNFTLLLFKFLAGILGNSAAMLADAVHSLSDFVSDVIILYFVKIAGKPQDADHDFGHGKYETVATLLVGLILVGVGMLIFASGISTIYAMTRGTRCEEPGVIALVAAVVSIVTKELLYQYTAFKGRRLNSQVMIANAWHHRSDAFSSIGSMLGIGGAILLGEAWRVLDPIAAICISVYILYIAFKLIVPCVDELLEKSLPEEDERFIMGTIASFPGVSSPHKLRTRRIGSYCAIEVHFCMDGATSLKDAHATTREIETALCRKFGADTIISTHVEPR